MQESIKNYWAMPIRLVKALLHVTENHKDFDDLVQEGRIALIEAAECYARGGIDMPENAYFYIKVRDAIFTATIELSHYSRYTVRVIKAIEQAAGLLRAQSEAVTLAAIAEQTGYSEVTLQSTLRAAGDDNWSGVPSLTSKAGGFEAAPPPPEAVADETTSPSDLIYRQEQKNLVRKFVPHLPMTEAVIINALLDNKTISEIGELLNSNRSNVGARRGRAIDTLQKLIENYSQC